MLISLLVSQLVKLLTDSGIPMVTSQSRGIGTVISIAQSCCWITENELIFHNHLAILYTRFYELRCTYLYLYFRLTESILNLTFTRRLRVFTPVSPLLDPENGVAVTHAFTVFCVSVTIVFDRTISCIWLAVACRDERIIYKGLSNIDFWIVFVKFFGGYGRLISWKYYN